MNEPMRAVRLAGLLLAGSTLVACSSTSKETVLAELQAIDKNRPVAEAGLERGTVRLEHGGETRELELLYHHAPAADPRPGAAPLVLVHGTPSTLFAWTELIHGTDGFAGLAEERDVYAIEVVGHGAAPGDLAPYDFDVCARFVVAAAESLGLERYHLAGSSYGGEFVWRAALMDPDGVASIVLLDSSGYPRREQDWLDEEVQMREHWLADQGWRLNSRERITSALEPHFDVVPPGRVDEFYWVASNAHNWKAMIDLARDENGERADEIPDITCPALLVWGADDIAYPPDHYAERFHRDLRDAELVVLDDAGHYPHEERPAETIAAMRRFFERVESER